MKHSIEYIMPFGTNKGFSLKTIFQYVPTYIEWLIKYIQDFEVDIIAFKNLPNPTIPNPKKILSENGLKLDPPIKLETSVQKILDYIEIGGIIKEVVFDFSKSTIQILELKRKGQYTAPEYIKSKWMSPEEVNELVAKYKPNLRIFQNKI